MAESELAELAREHAHADLDDAWARALEAPEAIDVDAHLEAARILDRQGAGGRASGLLALLLEPLRGAGRARDAVRVAREATLCSTRPDSIKADVLACYEAAFGDRPAFEAYTKLSGVRSDGPFIKSLERLETFLDFPVGRHVFHASSWGTGRVVSVDQRTGDLSIDFERKPGHKLPVDGAVQFLERIPDACLRARVFSDLAGLKAMSEDDPGELVRVAVRSRDGSATSAQIKKDLLDVVVEKKRWSKFWSGARKTLTHDPHVEITGGSRPVITLREDAVRFADEITAAIESASSLVEVCAAARRFVKEKDKHPEQVQAGDPEAVGAALQARLAADGPGLVEADPGLVVSGLLLLDGLDAGGHEALPEAVRALRTDLRPFLTVAQAMPDPTTLKRYVQDVVDANPDAYAPALADALRAAPGGVFQAIVQTLQSGGHGALAAQSLADLVGSSDPDPDALVELSKDTFAGRLDDLEGAPPATLVFERLLAFADRVERLRAGGDPTAPNLRPKLKTLLASADHRAVRRYFDEAQKSSVKHTYHRVMSSRAIEDEVREVARALVVRRFPDLLATRERYYWEDEGAIFTTQRGLDVLQAEFDEVCNEKIPANRKAIGDAAAHGDLSENAEFTAALEERDQLVARADRLKGELERAKLLDEVDRPADVVGPGTRVELTDTESGEREFYVILGPWDVDLERRIISYTAPLAQGLLGQKVGESASISLPGGGRRAFTVEAIEDILTPDHATSEA